MKQAKYILIALVVLTSLNSCKKFLNTTPTDTLSPELSYSSEDNLIKALAGVYDLLANFTTAGLYGSSYINIEACTDDSYYARSAQTTGVNVYNFNFSEPSIVNNWNDCYKAIMRANALIANINRPEMSESKRAEILAEAKFMRGFYYFFLVTRYGDVPLRLEPTSSPNNLDIARTPAKEVYTQILMDMTEAEANLPKSSQIGHSSRVSKTVVQGILARVCLHMAGQPLNDKSKYADALAWAKKVQQSGEHTLNTTFNNVITNNAFSQIFINHSQDIYNVKESMWEVDFKGNRSDGYFEPGRVGNTMGITMTSVKFQSDTGYCYGFIKGTGRLYKLFGAKDQRRDWTLTNYTYNNSTGLRVPIVTSATNVYSRDAAKWRRSYETLMPKSKNDGPTNYPILRYSDVLLMLAEAENQVNGPTAVAYDALNMVRRRGYGVNLSTPSLDADAPSGMSKDAFQSFIEDERSRELAFESLRRQDLIRWGKFITNLKEVSADMAANGAGVSYGKLGGQNVAEHHLLFPIPANEIALNKKMVQNPGY